MQESLSLLYTFETFNAGAVDCGHRVAMTDGVIMARPSCLASRPLGLLTTYLTENNASAVPDALCYIACDRFFIHEWQRFPYCGRIGVARSGGRAKEASTLFTMRTSSPSVHLFRPPSPASRVPKMPSRRLAASP